MTSQNGIPMSEGGAAAPESEEADQRGVDIVALLITLGAVGIVLFRIYKAVESIRKTADEVGGAFSLLAPSLPKSQRKRQGRSRRTRIAGKR